MCTTGRQLRAVPVACGGFGSVGQNGRPVSAIEKEKRKSESDIRVLEVKLTNPRTAFSCNSHSKARLSLSHGPKVVQDPLHLIPRLPCPYTTPYPVVCYLRPTPRPCSNRMTHVQRCHTPTLRGQLLKFIRVVAHHGREGKHCRRDVQGLSGMAGELLRGVQGGSKARKLASFANRRKI